MTIPVVHLYTVCWDEADMLGFFFRHYDPWVDRYVVFDDGSTDGSLDILRDHPKVELRPFVRREAQSFVLSHKAMQDDAWKESRGLADWIVITAIDEHLHVPGRDMRDYLAEQAEQGVTLLPALGFDMNHPSMPEDSGRLVDTVTQGRPRSAFNKLSIFRPLSVRETNFGPGRHAADPIGDLRLPIRDDVLLWHYKHLGFERNAAREAAQARRLGKVDVEKGFGQHYLWSKEKLRAFWDEMEAEASDLTRSDFRPEDACIRPLWWDGRRDFVRVSAQPKRVLPAVLRQDPTVSVLIKAYNHSAYVRQTIESVLVQEGPDLEIVVTDDGSTDGTLEILRSFDDPRIRLEALPRNLGISAAMNATVSRARGRYLAILNSDDWALPGRFERQTEYLDRNPGVSLVFGMPQPVDEAGEPIEAFNDFTFPLRFPDFTRRTFLRHFFFSGNCLCSPTAMIRRESYVDVGPYDCRLTNLQDFDMWIRMLVAGRTIHVLPDALTALRIRANKANASAPRLDNHMRTAYEHIKILSRFAAFSEELYSEIFGDAEEIVTRSSESVAQRVATLAAGIPQVAFQNFALGEFYSAAQSVEEQAQFRELAGSLDGLNIQAVTERDHAIIDLGLEQRHRDNAISALRDELEDFRRDLAASNERQRHLEELADRTASDLRQRDHTIEELRASADHKDNTLARVQRLYHDVEGRNAQLTTRNSESEKSSQILKEQLVAAIAEQDRMRRSLTWRITAIFRWIGSPFTKLL